MLSGNNMTIAIWAYTLESTHLTLGCTLAIFILFGINGVGNQPSIFGGLDSGLDMDSDKVVFIISGD